MTSTGISASAVVDNALNDSFNIDTHDDEGLLQDKNYSWDDLISLKTELGNNILEFVSQVTAVITNQDIITRLGDKRDHFNKVVNVFFSDINEFSNKVKDLRVQHDNKTGPITDLNEFGLYNRLAIMYHSLFNELSVLIIPTLSDLMITISEVTYPEPVVAQEEVKE